PADHRTACDPDSESGVPSLARAARSAPTTHPRPPMASPSSTPTPNVDDRCRRTSLPPTGSLHSLKASKRFVAKNAAVGPKPSYVTKGGIRNAEIARRGRLE